MTKYLSLIFPVVALILAVFLLQSRSREDFLLAGNGAQKQELQQLFALLGQEKEPGAGRFALIQQISNLLKKEGELSKINLFLSSYVSANPSDPFNANYQFQIAENYRQMNAPQFAVRYYERILKTQPDILIKGESIHYYCLSQLIRLDDNPATRLGYFKELMTRFPDRITSAQTYYLLGRNYEALGEWGEAMEAYSNFLSYPEPVNIGDPKAFQRIESLVKFYNTDKKWVSQDLDSLIKKIRSAVTSGNVYSLENLRSKVNFFILSWDRKDVPVDSSEAFDIWPFLKSNVQQSSTSWGTTLIEFDSKLASDSNESEAFIRTTGWNYRFPTWFFYFRKIDFPPDPEINGAWEWAGIYFGEKL